MGLGVVAVAGFLACDENSPPPTDPGGTNGTVDYVDEGTAGTPLDITGLTPYDGEVSKNGYSYYRITGVTPDEICTITLTRSDGLPYQVVPNIVIPGEIACGRNNDTPGAVIACAIRSTAGGVLDFHVNGDTTVGGAFEISFTPGGPDNEGLPDAPVEISSFPFSGGALTGSYYLLSGLVPGTPYACEFTASSGPASILIYSDDTYQSQTTLCNTLSGSGRSCNIFADASGHIYLRIAGLEYYGITYTISVTAASVANEGSRDTSIDITSELPYSGMVHLGTSYYILSGLTPGSPYTVSLSNATDDADLRLYGPGWDVSQIDCYHWWENGDGVSIECVSMADARGEIRIRVSGRDSADGATFDIDMTPGGIPSEGNHGAPVDITGAIPWSGSVYKTASFYKITGMAVSTDYTVTISNLTDDLMMSVFDDETYQNFLCKSTRSGTADETCTVQTATGEFHIRVYPSDSAVRGATYLLNVTP
jgi:hypothetical protein